MDDAHVLALIRQYLERRRLVQTAALLVQEAQSVESATNGVQKTVSAPPLNLVSVLTAHMGLTQDHSSGKLEVVAEVDDEDLLGSSSATSSPQCTSTDLVASADSASAIVPIPVTKTEGKGDGEHKLTMKRANSYQPQSQLELRMEAALAERKGSAPQEYVRPKRVSTSTGHQRPVLPDVINNVALGMQQSGFIPIIPDSQHKSPPSCIIASVGVSKKVPEVVEPGPGTPGSSTNRSRRSRTSSISEETRVHHIITSLETSRNDDLQALMTSPHLNSPPNNELSVLSSPIGLPLSVKQTLSPIYPAETTNGTTAQDNITHTSGKDDDASSIPKSSPRTVSSTYESTTSSSSSKNGAGETRIMAVAHQRLGPVASSSAPAASTMRNFVVTTPATVASPLDIGSEKSSLKGKHILPVLNGPSQAASVAMAAATTPTAATDTTNHHETNINSNSNNIITTSSNGNSSLSTELQNGPTREEAIDHAATTTPASSHSSNHPSNAPKEVGAMPANGLPPTELSSASTGTDSSKLYDKAETDSLLSESADQPDEYSDDDDLGYVRISSIGLNNRHAIQHLSVFSFDDSSSSSSSSDSDDTLSSDDLAISYSDSGSDDEQSLPPPKHHEKGSKHSKYGKLSTKATAAHAAAGSRASVTGGATGGSALFHMDDVVSQKRHKAKVWNPSRWTSRPLPKDGPTPYLKLPEFPTGAEIATATPTVMDFSSVNVKRSRLEKDVHLEYFNMKVVYDSQKTGFEATHDFPIRVADVIGGRYEIVEYLGSAAFSRAVKCIDHLRGTTVCLKIIKNNKDYFDQSLDEIKLLTIIKTACAGRCDDFHVLELYDYFYFKEHLFLVCELLRENLYEVYKYNRQSGETLYFNIPRLQRVAWQCLVALNFIHRRNLIHCDLKPENILIKSYSRSLIKVIDFGSSCFTSDQLSSYVQSRSYRAPEVVLGYPYDQRIDIWSLGCILAELWTGRVLFQNESLATLIAKHIGIIGLQKSDRTYLKDAPLADDIFTADGVVYEKKQAPNGGPTTTDYIQIKRTSLRKRLQSTDPLFLSFVSSLLRINPTERPTSWEAMHHPWFRHVYPDP